MWGWRKIENRMLFYPGKIRAELVPRPVRRLEFYSGFEKPRQMTQRDIHRVALVPSLHEGGYQPVSRFLCDIHLPAALHIRRGRESDVTSDRKHQSAKA